ncbi:copper-binding protein [Noviherbaspirillum sp. Root189]|uniref:copper-binding protein n=1 Tax=Noviherbaspirillum sp. Root189 TaxID=1736487 RepID=UPI00070C832E|nr:copper-binding protein [Noviherbaspirillum sp. Root189]KRB79516.1 copper transporter [Noviherbaspirillum sp. Root189]
MKTSLFKSILALGLMAAALTAHADQMNGGKRMDMGGMKMDGMAEKSSEAARVNEGEVKAVDQAGKTVTLKHGPVKSKTVEMPPMTMTFSVEKDTLLSKVKVGDKVKFNVETVKGTAVVTALQVQK